MKVNTKFYWGKTQQQNYIIVPTRTIVNLCMYVMTVTDMKQKHKSVFNRNQARKAIKGILYV